MANLADLLTRSAARCPDRAAIRRDTRTLSYAELDAAAARMALEAETAAAGGLARNTEAAAAGEIAVLPLDEAA